MMFMIVILFVLDEKKTNEIFQFCLGKYSIANICHINIISYKKKKKKVLDEKKKYLFKAMGSSTACFRSQLPSELTNDEINQLKEKTNLKKEDIDQWYSRFIHCYPNGYLNEKDFLDYYQQLYEEFSNELIPFLKQLFHLFDLNSDQKIHFYEFILFNILLTDGTIEEKFQLISNLFDQQKEKDWNKYQLKEISRNIFHLFDIQISKSNLNDLIDLIFKEKNLKKDELINWKVFIQSILHHQSLEEDYSSIYSVIQRSQRF